MKLDIIKTEDIYLKAFKYVASKSKSNTLPYHNLEHLIMVFNNAYSASQHYKLDEVLRETATKELCLAALFHDSNHSGGKLTDDKNLSNATKFFTEFLTEYNNGTLSEDDVKFKDTVIDIMMATEFPHKDIELTIQHNIIRDCDMMSITQDNHIYSTIFGLGAEFGVDTVKTQVKNQISFILSLKMNTDWGSQMLEEKIGGVMNDLSALSKMFNNDSFSKGDISLEDSLVMENSEGEKIVIVE